MASLPMSSPGVEYGYGPIRKYRFINVSPPRGSDWCWILRPPVPLRCTGGYNIGSPSGLGMQTRFIEYLINMDLASKPQGEINLTPTGVAQCHSPLCSVAERGVPMASLPMSSPGAEYGYGPIRKYRFINVSPPRGFRLVVDPETPRSASLHRGL